MSLEQDNTSVVLKFIEAMSEADTAAIFELYSYDATCWTSGKTLISGTKPAEEIRPFADAILESFPKKLAFTVTGVTAQGNRVAVEAESDGDHVSGQHYHNYYHFMFELRDGKVTKLREYMDTELVTEVLCGGQRPE